MAQDSNSTTTTTIEAEDAATGPQTVAFPYLLDADPATLLTDRNVREAKLDKAFVASICAEGVLVPIVAVCPLPLLAARTDWSGSDVPA